MADPQGASRLLTDDEVGIGTASGAAPRLLSDADVGITPAGAPTGFGFQALQQGANTAGRAVSSTLQVAGDALGDTTLGRGAQAARGFVDRNTPDAPVGYVPSGPAATEAFNQGNYGEMLGHLPGVIAESAPGMAATIGAGALGTAVGGPVAGLAAAGATSAAQTFGPVAQTRAANNGTVAHDPGNMLAAAGTTAAVAGIDAVTGMGGRLMRPAATGLIGRTGRAAAVTAGDGLGEAAQDVIQQTGETLGTERGLAVDPGQAVVSGLAGAGTRVAMTAPGAVTRGAVESVAMAGGERAMGDMPPAQAESVARLNDLVTERYAAVRERTGREPNMEDVLNGARSELDTQIATLITNAQTQGWLTKEEAQEIRGTAFEQARRHNKELPDEVADALSGEIAQGLARLDNLHRAPAVFSQNMRALLTDLDNLSQASRKKNLTGPFETAGRVAGGLVGIGIGAHLGGPIGAVGAAAGAMGGAPLAARVGGTIGRGIDRLAGTRMPAIVLARQKALKILAKSGVEDYGNTRALQGELDRVLGDENLARRAALGMKVDPETMAKVAAEAAQRKLEKQTAEKARKVAEAEVARHVAMTDGNPALDAKVRQARARAEAAVALATARDLGGEEATRIKMAKAKDKADAAALDAALARTAAEADTNARKAAIEKARQSSNEAEADRLETERHVAMTEGNPALDRAIQRAKEAAEARVAAQTARDQGAEIASGIRASRKAARVEARRAEREAAREAAKADEVPTEAPLPDTTTEPASDPSKPQDGPTMGTTGNYNGPSFGWRQYVKTSFRNKGAKITTEEVDAAVREIGEAENTDPEMVAAILKHDGKLDQKLLGAILGVVAKNQGWNYAETNDVVPGQPQGGQGPGYWNGVNKPAAWQGVADYVQRHIETYREAALANDRDLGLAADLGLLGMPDGTVSKENRKVIAKASLAAAPEGQRDFRRAALSPWLTDAEPTPDSPPPSPPPPKPPKAKPAPTPPAPEPAAPPEVAEVPPEPQSAPRALTPAEVIARLRARRPDPTPPSAPRPGRALMDGSVGSREVVDTGPSPAELAQRRSKAARAVAEMTSEGPVGRTTVNGQEVTDAVLSQAERAFRSMSPAQQQQNAALIKEMREANIQWKRQMLNAEKVDKGAER